MLVTLRARNRDARVVLLLGHGLVWPGHLTGKADFHQFSRHGLIMSWPGNLRNC